MGLVNLDGAAQHDPVLVAGYRGKHAVPPLEGRLVGDAAQLGRALDGDVVAHEPDEGDPGGERLAAVLQDGAGEGGEPPAAAAAAPPRDAGSDGAAPPDRSSDCSFEVVTRAIEMSNGSSPRGCG